MYFIYTYKDPITKEIFYVGKGQRYRHLSHLKPSLWKNPHKSPNPYFYNKIKNLMRNQTKPIIEILNYFENEEDALKEEFRLIDELKTFNDGGSLLNIFVGVGPKSGYTVDWSDERRENFKRFCKERRIFDPSYDELYDMFIIKNMRRKEIAEKYNVSDVLVKKRLKELNIKKSQQLSDKNRQRKVKKKCKYCGKEYDIIPMRMKGKYESVYCSVECSRKSRLKKVEFKGIIYNDVYEAHRKTNYSIGYIRNRGNFI